MIFSIPIVEVKYDDATRQRKDPTEGLDELAESIRRLGLINPIIVDSEGILIAGRRRLEACKRLGADHILARRFDDLSPIDKRLVELDENLRRVDLSWQETALAIAELHDLKCAEEGVWDQERTAEYTGHSPPTISRNLAVAAALRQGDEKVQAAPGVTQAWEILRRRRELVLQTALSRGFDETFLEELGDGDAPLLDRGLVAPAAPEDGRDIPSSTGLSPLRLPAAPSAFRIVHADFLTWIAEQSVPQYNLIHCDFPYGLNMERSAQAGSASHDTQYADSVDLFWALTDALLSHQNRFVLSSAHMVFWFSMKYYTQLKAELEAGGWFVVPHPLIWHKSDNAGIASDYRRRPKHIYETAFLCSRGDRPLGQLRNDVYSAPLAKADEGHLSAKPLAMLEYFLSMICDSNSYVLDPTCGSGTAIRAAQRLGAVTGLGLEISPETAAAAQLKLEQSTHDAT